MGRKSTPLIEYQRLAAQHNLEYLEPVAARTIHDSVRWKCLNCGRITPKSYQNVRVNRYSCNCEWQIVPLENYEKLAKRLGIRWIGEKLPQNAKKLTKWRGTTDFSASYSMLAYGRIPKRLLEYLPEAING